MGCGASIIPASEYEEKPTDNEVSIVEWKILPSNVEARKKFEADGTLTKNSDPGHLELRTMLEEAFSQHAIGKYAKDIKALDIFMCWVDIQEFKSIPKITDTYRRSKALHIYHKYIKQQSVLEIGDIDPFDRERYKSDIDLSKDDPSSLAVGFYDKIQFKCFLAMYHHIYIPFKLTKEYFELTQQIKKRYNNVRLSDFEYFNKLGEGGFGFVVHCRKKSTGKHYAMKLQTKTGLLECFQDDPLRADFEKQAFASCQHPFIVNLDYAFQTDSLAIMVLGLATAGDLQKALNKSPDEKLNEDRVRFYVAEMVLALSYLHQLGLMYRDLKPNNVLLNEDGHIQLVDLGGVADEHGTTLGKHNEVHGLVPLFTQTFSSPNYASLNTDVAEPQQSGASPGAAGGKEGDGQDESGGKKPKRKLSIMGTFGCACALIFVELVSRSALQVHGAGDGDHAESGQLREDRIHRGGGLVVAGRDHVQAADGVPALHGRQLQHLRGDGHHHERAAAGALRLAGVRHSVPGDPLPLLHVGRGRGSHRQAARRERQDASGHPRRREGDPAARVLQGPGLGAAGAEARGAALQARPPQDAGRAGAVPGLRDADARLRQERVAGGGAAQGGPEVLLQLVSAAPQPDCRP